MSWLDDLEARLDSQLQDFLRSNPDQQALVKEQERRDRQQSLRRQRLQLQEQAELGRSALLQLAHEIRCWQERVQRARAAGAADLASRAETHVAGLMEQGRQRWQTLAELGQQFSQVEWELSELTRQGRDNSAAAADPSAAASPRAPEAKPGSGDDLNQAWDDFEAQQELDALKQKLRR